jgi:hypothetical protein
VLGNRIIKLGLVISVLGISYTAQAITLEYIATMDELTKTTHDWARHLFDTRAMTPLSMLLYELETKIITPLQAFEKSIPDVPPANALLKTTVHDLSNSLTLTKNILLQSKSIRELQKQKNECNIQKCLEQARKNLDILINHIAEHPDMYSTEVLVALRDYRNKTLEAIYNEWRPKGISYYLSGLLHRWKCI